LVKVGSSEKFGCYKGEIGAQCWRTAPYEYDYHEWCNIPNENCTMSLYKSAKCASKHKHTKDNGSICVNNWKDKYCDFRTGKRYGCYKLHSTCWRTCDWQISTATDEMCCNEGWCFAYAGTCTRDSGCLISTTKPCTDYAS